MNTSSYIIFQCICSLHVRLPSSEAGTHRIGSQKGNIKYARMCTRATITTHRACIFKSRRRNTSTYRKSSDRNRSADQIFKRYKVGMRWKVSEEPEERGAGVGVYRESRERKYERPVDGGYRPTFSTLKNALWNPTWHPTDFFILFSPLSLMFFWFFFPFSFFLWFWRLSKMARSHTHTHRNMYPHIFPHFPAMVGLLTLKEEKKNRGGIEGCGRK